MARSVREQLKSEVNVPDPEMVQYVGALGAAILGHRRLGKLREQGSSADAGTAQRAQT
jgi:activator of 2-hydroxyglutaryl-CoA dehydratase